MWTQIAAAFKSFNSRLMLECFNEPNEAGGGNTPQARADLNLSLEACFSAIGGHGRCERHAHHHDPAGGRQPHSGRASGRAKVSFISDPNLIISLHRWYFPPNFGLSTTAYAWGSASDYTNYAKTPSSSRSESGCPTRPLSKARRRLSLAGFVSGEPCRSWPRRVSARNLRR